MSAVKALQQWCRVQCEGYRDVAITNMTTSFRDGLAFCALIHKHRPDLINFNSLRKEDVYENNKLAFKVAEEQLGIPALLDAEDMVALKVPDRLSILTYVSQYYNYFHGRSPIGGMGGMKRPAEAPNGETPGKKNHAVVSKVFPASKNASEEMPPPPPPPPLKVTRPSPSPTQNRRSAQNAPAERTPQTGTLSNKCVTCSKHVHLVQRHLVEGKLYHRNCAKLLKPNASTVLRDLPTNTHVSKLDPKPDALKIRSPSPAPAPPKVGPRWLTEKPSPTSSLIRSPSPHAPSSSPTPSKREYLTPAVSKPSSVPSLTTNSTSTSAPVPAPRSSLGAVKTRDSKLKFLQEETSSHQNENKPGIKDQKVTAKTEELRVGDTVTLQINLRDASKGSNVDKTSGLGDNALTTLADQQSNKNKAAALISKKLSEENNNDGKPAWMSVSLRKTEKLQPLIETSKKDTEALRGRTRLKADPTLLADLHPVEKRTSSHSPANRSGLSDRGLIKADKSPPNSPASVNESPADWRSRLRPVSKGSKPSDLREVSPKPCANGSGKNAEFPPELSSSSSAIAEKTNELPNNLNQHNSIKSGAKTCKTKLAYIPKDDIIRELKDIEENLNELEKRGVELEIRLRSEEDAANESLMDELMEEWFGLIKNKQVAMRRESELVYIGRTQELEEEQPSVEQELRRLMEKPEHLKTLRDRKREAELMQKLLEIVNDRNAIVEGLDEDRLREEEEDEQLNKMMMDFNFKKDKTKKKNSMSKFFSWGNKKEA